MDFYVNLYVKIHITKTRGSTQSQNRVLPLISYMSQMRNSASANYLSFLYLIILNRLFYHLCMLRSHQQTDQFDPQI